jgi:hypothetical protein
MAGTPIKRARKEAASRARAETLSAVQAAERNVLKDPVIYTPELAQELAALIASGVAIGDSEMGGAVIVPGIASRVGISEATLYKWQREHPELAAAIDDARIESSHRIADKILTLANVALAEPTMANACRVAGDLYKWQAAVRNPGAYSEKHELTVKRESWSDFLKRLGKNESALHRITGDDEA